MTRRSPRTAPDEFVVLLFPGFSNLCLANAVEPLRAANALSGRELYRWRFAAMTEGAVRSSSGLPVTPETWRSDMSGQALLVMPSYDHLSQVTPALTRALRAASGRFELLIGLDTGSWLLGAAGLLDGRRATSHWDVLTALAEAFPEIDVVSDRFVIDGDRASCGGATSTLDLMLELVARRHGTALALDVAALFLYGGGPAGPGPEPPALAHGTLRKAATIMRQHLEEPVSIARIAAMLGLSQRRLEALFRDRSGMTAAQLYRRIRLAEAHRRVTGTTESVAEIAGRCGYADPSAMTRAFRLEYGLSPSALRRGGAAETGERP